MATKNYLESYHHLKSLGLNPSKDCFDRSGRIDGHVTPKTKFTHPYNYDPFTVWELGCDKKANGSVYTDRLYQWDYKKYNKLCEKHFGNKGQYFDQRKPEKIEAFLRDYTDNQELILIEIIEYCNQATGFPVWRLDYFSG